MTEKLLLLNNLQLHHKGVFNFDELYSAISRSLDERGYRRHQKRFEEALTPQGKNLYVEMRPVKSKTMYLALAIKIRIEMRNVKEIVLTIDDAPANYQEGEVDISFDAWVTTDHEHRWGGQPWFFLIKSLINHWIYKFPMEEHFMGEVVSDTRYIYNQINAHLNLYQYRVKGSAEKLGKEQGQQAKS